MENAEAEKSSSPEENSSQLNRNRSFKSKQLVRSQAIREAASPPRAVSPSPHAPSTDGGETNSEDSSHRCSDEFKKKLPVEIQVGERYCCTLGDRSVQSAVARLARVALSAIRDGAGPFPKVDVTPGPEKEITSGGWDETHCEQRQRARRWLSDAPRDLLSNNPRVACVCGACACPNCRGRRRRHACPTKQDSGIVCSDDCPDCTDVETAGPNNEVVRKSCSLDVEDQMYYCRCPERKDRPKNIMLSRNDSGDYQKYERNEPTGPELVAFIKDTLNKNPRDRMALLKIEKELHSLVNDTGRCIVRFPVMTSYGRMLVHRCASLFQLSHHLDQANKTCVLVSKSGTCGGRIPCTSFKEWCTATFPPSPQRHQQDVQHAKSILKRDAHSLDEPGSGSLASNRSKSLEQREKEYERVRRRIFSSQEEAQWPWLASGPVKLLTPDSGGRNKLLKVQSLEGSGAPSTNSNWRGRGAVSKSHSFGGYTGAEQPHQPRLLSRQGDLASSSWRLSPSSSGYKTLSLRSTDSITPSPTGGASPEPSVNMSQGVGPSVGPMEGAAVVWAVTDMSAVPAGAVVIHPQTGRPLTNPDGSLYHFDPANPPVLYDPGAASEHHEQQQQMDQNNEKRRGRLEKQHSFIDHECECQPTEECRNKCCCECRRHEGGHQQQRTSEKETNTPASPKPSTPIHQSPQPPQPAVLPTQVQQPEPTNQQFDLTPTEQKPEVIETPNHRSFENQNRTNQKQFDVQKNLELENQRASNEMNRARESQEMQYQQMPQGYRTDEVTSPQQQVQNHFIHQEVNLQQGMMTNKMTPVPIPDPNIRPMSLTNMTNMIYPGAVAQGYPYHVRLDAPMQVYQQMIQPEEHKLTSSPHANEATFRIDPSYPYAAVDYTGVPCGACTDTNPMQHQQRSYSVPYSQVEIPQVLPGPYAVGNMILPQPHLQPYPYQEAVPWAPVPAAKLVLPELYPAVLPYHPPAHQPAHHYQHYNVMYPQVIPQPYPICQPIYPVIEPKPPERRNSIPNARVKRNSICNSSRNTPDKAAYEEQARQAEIAAKIQQIKSQMAELNVKDGGKRPERTERAEWKEGRRRNSGNGLLGNCPVNNFNGRVIGRSQDEAHLSSAARAIVNSIRNMQAKNNTYQDNRREYQRFDYKDRPRRQERDDKDKPSAGQSAEQERYDVRPRGINVPLYRQPYLLRQMSAGTWCRRSPPAPAPAPPALQPLHPVLNPQRRPHPDTRNPRR